MRNVLLVTALLVVAPCAKSAQDSGLLCARCALTSGSGGGQALRLAQQAKPAAPSHDAPSPADLEPGVNTSAPAPADTPAPAATPAAKPAAASKPPASSKAVPAPTGDSLANRSVTAPTGQPKTDMASKTDTQPEGARPGADTRTAKSGATNGKKGDGKAEDHLQLDTTQITGNQELPKVLYIVPWKRSDLGDLLGRPANSLLDELLQPVDRDVFRRENRYYDALKPDAAAAGKAGAGAAQTSGDKH
jgi:hypothetical protein